MRYPTREEVESADRLALGRWIRFLPSPGASAVARLDFEEVMRREEAVMNRILERFHELGGWTSNLSKEIGWDD